MSGLSFIRKSERTNTQRRATYLTERHKVLHEVYKSRVIDSNNNSKSSTYDFKRKKDIRRNAAEVAIRATLSEYFKSSMKGWTEWIMTDTSYT